VDCEYGHTGSKVIDDDGRESDECREGFCMVRIRDRWDVGILTRIPSPAIVFLPCSSMKSTHSVPNMSSSQPENSLS
jgi:hypothetical protein